MALFYEKYRAIRTESKNSTAEYSALIDWLIQAACTRQKCEKRPALSNTAAIREKIINQDNFRNVKFKSNF